MAGRLVQRTIEKLKPPAAGNKIEWDSEIPGFGVRITSAKAIAFVLDYRINGRKRRYTIGRYPELTATAARERALQLRGGILDGKDPLEQRSQDRSAPTVSDLSADYLERYAVPLKRKSSLRNDKQMLEAIVGPKLGSLRVKAVLKRDIQELHHSLKATPYRANRVLSLLSKMFSLAVEWGWRPDNPVRGIERFHEDRREKWLSVDELQRFIAALDSYPDRNAANALRLLLLTGARSGEVLSAQWEHFDLPRGIWTKPTHHTKQKRTEYVPLSAPALDLLVGMKGDTVRGALFPGQDENETRSTLRRPWVQICKAAGLSDPYVVQGKRGPLARHRPILRIHDLRHSYASHLISNGVSLHVVGKLLGHTEPNTTARYAHVADGAQRDATNRFGEIFNSAGRKQS